MVHGWYLEPEYPEDVDYLLELAREVRPKLRGVAVALGAPLECDECGTTLDDMVSAYDKIPSDDLTCYVTKYDDGSVALAQLASGGGGCRKMKGVLRMSMCALILYELGRWDRAHPKLKGDVEFHHG